MSLEKTWSSNRIFYILLMYVITIAFSGILFGAKVIELYKIWQFLIISIVFLTLILLNIEFKRLKLGYTDEKTNNTIMILCCYTLCLAMIFFCSFFHYVIVPISICSIIFTIILYKDNGIYFAIYFSVLYFLINEPGANYLLYYIITSVLVSIIAEYLLDKKTRIQSILIIISVHFIILVAIDYYTYLNIDIITIKNELICGGIATVLGLAFATFYNYITETKTVKMISKMTSPDYELLLRLKEKSESTYNHCIKTAMLAKAGANILEIDPVLVYTGALYSRIGIIIDNNYIKNNITIGNHYHFPRKIIKIIYESSGKKDILPTSKEAAVVMLSDSCVSAFEKLNNSNKSGLNKEIIIQQIFNSKSNDGYIEESGITMKMYLDLKACFVKESDNI